jgi:dihydrofolate reductase
MSRLVYSMMLSLDGFVETTDRSLDWVSIDEEIHTSANEQARAAEGFVYGRGMYELMAGYWPTADADPAIPAYMAEFAAIWREMPKVVCSRTLERVEWNSRLVRGDAVAEVAALKVQPGGDLLLGGPTLAAPLVRAGLVDEYRLLVNPVVLGNGTPFFPSPADRVGLRLVESRPFDAGVVYLRYERT